MDRRVTAGVLTISDKGAHGQRTDETGEVVFQMLQEHGYSVLRRDIVPDDHRRIVDTLLSWVDGNCLSLIITSGGTGLSPRDVTPQATTEVIDYQVPGIGEAMRSASLKKTPHAMLSRALAGVRKACLIINLPGSPKGAEENLSVILPALDHALEKLAGDISECATT